MTSFVLLNLVNLVYSYFKSICNDKWWDVCNRGWDEQDLKYCQQDFLF